MGRFPLQVCTVVLSLIPIITGVVTLLGIKDPLYRPLGLPSAPLLDSNLRFFGGVWLGLGLAMLWLVPSIEKHTVLFRAIWGAIFVGGIGRIVSMLLVGMPPIPFLGFTALELFGAPLFVYWQYQVSRL